MLTRRSCLQGEHAQAVQYLTRALHEARQGFGPDDPHVAAACHNLAESYRLTRDFAAAEPLYTEVRPSTGFWLIQCYKLSSCSFTWSFSSHHQHHRHLLLVSSSRHAWHTWAQLQLTSRSRLDLTEAGTVQRRPLHP